MSGKSSDKETSYQVTTRALSKGNHSREGSSIETVAEGLGASAEASRNKACRDAKIVTHASSVSTPIPPEFTPFQIGTAPILHAQTASSTTSITSSTSDSTSVSHTTEKERKTKKKKSKKKYAYYCQSNYKFFKPVACKSILSKYHTCHCSFC